MYTGERVKSDRSGMKTETETEVEIEHLEKEKCITGIFNTLFYFILVYHLATSMLCMVFPHRGQHPVLAAAAAVAAVVDQGRDPTHSLIQQKCLVVTSLFMVSSLATSTNVQAGRGSA